MFDGGQSGAMSFPMKCATHPSTPIHELSLRWYFAEKGQWHGGSLFVGVHATSPRRNIP